MILNNTYFFFKGRVALYAILKAIGIKQGDEIIVPGFTCIVVPNAITYLKATPVYVDIDARTYNIDQDKIEARITRKTRAIIAQHTYGIPAEMDRLNEIAKKHGLYLIEDSCHAIGSEYKGERVGTYGDAAFFSSQWSKPITTGLGGWAVVNNPELKARMEEGYPQFINPTLKEDVLLRLQYLMHSQILRPSTFWIVQSTYRMLSRLGLALGSSSNEELECKMPGGYEKKMSEWQRKLLETKLKEIQKIIDHRIWVTSLYEKELKKKGTQTVVLPDHYRPVFLRYPVPVKNKARVLEEAREKRIEIGDWFVSPIHPNLEGWDKVSYQKGMCPIAENICQHVINLPTHMRIDEKEARRIVEFIGEKEKRDEQCHEL
jgi:perosamine synthetase